jgi:aldose 1-epimerase
MPWSVTGAATCSVRAGGNGWPWPYEVTLAAEGRDNALSLHWRLTNLADEPMPAGIGFHPWWRRPVQLRVDAGLTYASNLTPTPDPQRVGGGLDLRALAVPTDGLDGTWTDATLRAIELAWPGLGLRATLTASANARYVAVATPPELDAIAVEPQTHAPDGLRRLLDGRPGGLLWLPAAESLAFDLEIRVSRG